MKKKYRILCLSLAAVLVVGAAWFALPNIAFALPVLVDANAGNAASEEGPLPETDGGNVNANAPQDPRGGEFDLLTGTAPQEGTEAPDATEAQVSVAQTPETQAPETQVSEIQTFTEAPKSTTAPKATETPKSTAAPKTTETPKPTAAPKATATPKATETPKSTTTPKATETPRPTAAPKVQTQAQDSKATRPSAQPTPPAPTPKQSGKPNDPAVCIHTPKHQKIEATCEKNGMEYDECTKCGVRYNVRTISATGHSYQEYKKAATCHSSGYCYEKCTKCGKEINTRTYPALQHKWGTELITVSAPTCTSKGVTARKCSLCGELGEWGSIPATGAHSFTTETKAATCTEPKTVTKRCTMCGYTEITTEGFPVGHQWDKQVTKAPTCTECGTDTYTCRICHATKEVTTPAAGHRWTLGDERNGLDKCAICGATAPSSGSNG